MRDIKCSFDLIVTNIGVKNVSTNYMPHEVEVFFYIYTFIHHVGRHEIDIKHDKQRDRYNTELWCSKVIFLIVKMTTGI